MNSTKLKRLDVTRFVQYLENYQKAYPGCSPTYREFAEQFGISTSHVSFVLSRLETEGRIVYVLGRETARSVSVPDGAFLTRADLAALGVEWGQVQKHQHRARAWLKKRGQ